MHCHCNCFFLHSFDYEDHGYSAAPLVKVRFKQFVPPRIIDIILCSQMLVGYLVEWSCGGCSCVSGTQGQSLLYWENYMHQTERHHPQVCKVQLATHLMCIITIIERFHCIYPETSAVSILPHTQMTSILFFTWGCSVTVYQRSRKNHSSDSCISG